MIEIVKTKPGDSNFHLFENCINGFYPSEIIPYTINEAVNVSFLHACYLLVSNNKVCARAALYNNPYLLYKNMRAFCVGNYESVNDANISSALLSHIEKEARENGARFLIGPMNGSTWDSYRFSLHHAYKNFFLEPYHHLYYNQQFIDSGFTIIAKYFSSIDTTLKFDEPDVVVRENELKSAGVFFRTIQLNDYENELKKLYLFNTITFKNNVLYTPLFEEAFIKKYSEAKNFIDEDFVILAEDEQHQVIGYFFCIEDILNTQQKSLIIKTIARHPDKKWKGLGHVIGNMIYKKAVEKNYKSIIHAFMNEAGTSTAISKDFFGNVYKNYALYGKKI